MQSTRLNLTCCISYAYQNGEHRLKKQTPLSKFWYMQRYKRYKEKHAKREHYKAGSGSIYTFQGENCTKCPQTSSYEIAMSTEIMHARQVGDHKPTAAMIDNKRLHMWRNLQELPKLQSPLYLYFLQIGGPAGEAQRFGGRLRDSSWTAPWVWLGSCLRYGQGSGSNSITPLHLLPCHLSIEHEALHLYLTSLVILCCILSIAVVVDDPYWPLEFLV